MKRKIIFKVCISFGAETFCLTFSVRIHDFWHKIWQVRIFREKKFRNSSCRCKRYTSWKQKSLRTIFQRVWLAMASISKFAAKRCVTRGSVQLEWKLKQWEVGILAKSTYLLNFPSISSRTEEQEKRNEAEKNSCPKLRQSIALLWPLLIAYRRDWNRYCFSQFGNWRMEIKNFQVISFTVSPGTLNLSGHHLLLVL